MTIHVTKPMTDDWILPSTSMGAPSNVISIEGCPSQSVPATFTVHAEAAITGLLPIAGSLAGAGGCIPSGSIDIKVVKCWWQARPTSRTSRQWMKYGYPVSAGAPRELTPELLLNDPSLLQTSGQDNYLKKTDGSYVKVSEESIGASPSAPSAAAMNVRDSETLLKADIPAGSNLQYWVTIRIPDDCQPGTYTGQILLGSVGAVEVQVEVLALELEPCPMPHVMFTFMLPGSATIGTRQKSQDQIAAELKSLCRPGVSLSLECQSDSAIRFMLGQMRQDGVSGTELQFTGLTYLMDVASSDAAHLAELKKQVLRVVAVCAEYGFTEVYFHGIDEAAASAIAGQKANFDAVHAAGGLVYVDGYTGVFAAAQAAGAKIDLIYWPTFPGAAEVANWHGIGAKIGMYGDPHSGVALAATFRRNYGLRLWQAGLDGAQIFWQWNSGGLIWSDFCNTTYVQEVMAYPTADGCVETVELQAQREAVTDLRYLATLQKAIDEASGNTTAAEEYLTWLYTANLAGADLDEIRSTLADHILALGGDAEPPTPPETSEASVGLVGILLVLGIAAAAAASKQSK